MNETPIGVGMIGCGTVGGGVARLLREQAAIYTARLGRPIELRRVLVRDTGKARAALPDTAALLTNDVDAFFDTPDMPIVIEAAGGRGVISEHVRRALRAGRHVVTANKSLLAAEGPALFKLAHEHDACIAFEASCGGGIPILTAIQFGLMANEIRAMYGILNGTCNYILTEMTQRGKSYAEALAEAQTAGFAEADPTLDVSGRDAAQKLAILAAIAFAVSVDEQQVWSEGIDTLDLQDIRLGAELGYDIKLLAIAEKTDGRVSMRVHPCFIHVDEAIAQVHGSFNALSVYGHAVGHTFYMGRGAGEMPTASAVVSDLLNVASGWHPLAFSHMRLWPDAHAPAKVIDAGELISRFYIRVNAMDKPGVMAQISHVLGAAGISISAILQHEAAAGQFVPVVITTHEAQQGPLNGAIAQLEQLDTIEGRPVCIRIVEMPAG